MNLISDRDSASIFSFLSKNESEYLDIKRSDVLRRLATSRDSCQDQAKEPQEERQMKTIMKIYERCVRLPFGKSIFSKVLCFKAPYFGSIKPLFLELRPGYCEILLRKRRAVTNHIGSVHAIAMCNVSELAAGTMLEASLPDTMRWIPKGMTVSYLKIAKTDLKATCEMSLESLEEAGELPIEVKVTDTNETEVFNAVITMHISPKKSPKS